MDIGDPLLWPPKLRRANGQGRRELTIGDINVNSLSNTLKPFDLRLKIVGRICQDCRCDNRHASSSNWALRLLKRAASANGVFSQVSMMSCHRLSLSSIIRAGRQRMLLSLSLRVILASNG